MFRRQSDPRTYMAGLWVCACAFCMLLWDMSFHCPRIVPLAWLFSLLNSYFLSQRKGNDPPSCSVLALAAPHQGYPTGMRLTSCTLPKLQPQPQETFLLSPLLVSHSHLAFPEIKGPPHQWPQLSLFHFLALCSKSHYLLTHSFISIQSANIYVASTVF